MRICGKGCWSKIRQNLLRTWYLKWITSYVNRAAQLTNIIAFFGYWAWILSIEAETLNDTNILAVVDENGLVMV